MEVLEESSMEILYGIHTGFPKESSMERLQGILYESS